MERIKSKVIERKPPKNGLTNLGQAVSGYENLPKDKLVEEGWLPVSRSEESRKEIQLRNAPIMTETPDRVQMLEDRIAKIEDILSSRG